MREEGGNWNTAAGGARLVHRESLHDARHAAGLVRRLASFDAAGLGVGILRDGMLLYANQRARTLLGGGLLREGRSFGEDAQRDQLPARADGTPHGGGASASLATREEARRGQSRAAAYEEFASGAVGFPARDALDVSTLDSSSSVGVDVAGGGTGYEAVYLVHPSADPSTVWEGGGMSQQQSGDRRSDEAARVPRVLICDDEVRLATLTAGLLSDHGYAVEISSTAADALEFLSATIARHVIVLLDVNLNNEMGAADLLERIEESGVSRPVILTSGLDPEDVPPELLDHPAVRGYLPKPFSVSQLLTHLSRATE